MRTRARRVRLALAGLGIGASLLARADFNGALKDYQAGRYQAARSEFAAVAELGDCSSQFNLGAMLLHGQGGPKDLGTAVGWLRAAASNGCQQLIAPDMTRVAGQISADEERSAAEIVARYGRAALRARGIVDPDFQCRGEVPAAPRVDVAPEYPPSADRAGGIVIAELTIGIDGLARDPQILVAEPSAAFAAAAVDAWLNTPFTPAMRDGVPVATRMPLRVRFIPTSGRSPWDAGAYKNARQAADSGEPGAEYLVGLTATVDSSIGVDAARGMQLILFAARDGYLRAQYWVGAQLRTLSACPAQQQGAASWLEHAAAGGDAAAQLLIASDLIAHSPAPAQASEARSLLQHAADSQDYYVMKHVVALLAAAPVAAVRDPTTAQQVATRLAAGPIQSDPQMFEALAAARAASGDFSAAASYERTAVNRARELAWDTRAMQERLGGYRARQPWAGDLFTTP